MCEFVNDWCVLRTSVLAWLGGGGLFDGWVVRPGLGMQYWTYPAHAGILILPWVVLPERWGWIGMGVMHVAVSLRLARRLGLTWVGTLAGLLSMPSFMQVYEGNMDWLAIGAFLSPAWAAPILAATKPHLGLGMLLPQIGRGRIRPIHAAVGAGVVLAGVALVGLPPIGVPAGSIWNWWARLWPVLVPAGLGAGWFLFRRRDWLRLGLVSSMLAPYANVRSLTWWMWALPERWLLVASLGSWALAGLMVLRAS